VINPAKLQIWASINTFSESLLGDQCRSDHLGLSWSDLVSFSLHIKLDQENLLFFLFLLTTNFPELSTHYHLMLWTAISQVLKS
jgi:hypothetical protein